VHATSVSPSNNNLIKRMNETDVQELESFFGGTTADICKVVWRAAVLALVGSTAGRCPLLPAAMPPRHIAGCVPQPHPTSTWDMHACMHALGDRLGIRDVLRSRMNYCPC
jgi:hypothetical protein